MNPGGQMLIVAIGGASVAIALVLDTMSYWKQIAKTLRTKKSAQVSSSQYLYKIAKATCAITGLAVYSNWVGVFIEAFMLAVYAASLIIVAKYKPKGWTLFDFNGKKKPLRKNSKKTLRKLCQKNSDLPY